jgi:hypothetical protein
MLDCLEGWWTFYLTSLRRLSKNKVALINLLKTKTRENINEKFY